MSDYQEMQVKNIFFTRVDNLIFIAILNNKIISGKILTMNSDTYNTMVVRDSSILAFSLDLDI